MPPSGGARLSALIQAKVAAGLSFTEFASRCIVDARSGKTLSVQWVINLSRGKVSRVPDDPALRALATGLELPERDVYAAAAEQWLGVVAAPVHGFQGSGVVVVPVPEDLSERDRERVRRRAERFAKDLHDSGDA